MKLDNQKFFNVIYFPFGSTYFGCVNRGKMHGSGVMFYESRNRKFSFKSLFIGEWENGKKNNEGFEIKYPHYLEGKRTTRIMIDNWKFGKRDGPHTIIYLDDNKNCLKVKDFLWNKGKRI